MIEVWNSHDGHSFYILCGCISQETGKYVMKRNITIFWTYLLQLQFLNFLKH